MKKFLHLCPNCHKFWEHQHHNFNEVSPKFLQGIDKQPIYWGYCCPRKQGPINMHGPAFQMWHPFGGRGK